MNVGLTFALAVLMAIATFIVRKVYGRKTVKELKSLVGLSIVLPVVLIAALGMLKMLNADVETSQQIASQTIDSVVTYLVKSIPEIIVGDIAGIIVGSAIAAFTGKG